MTDQDMTLAAYRAMRLGRCPFCDSHNVEGQRLESDAAVVWQDVICNDCSRDWQEVYLPALISYEEDGKTIEHKYINPGGGTT